MMGLLRRGRVRLALVGLLAAAVLVAGALAGSRLGDDSGPSPAPKSTALALIPAEALVALALSTDASRPAVRRAAKVVRRLPSWPDLRANLLERVQARGCGIDLRADDGDEIAFALLPDRGHSSSPLLVTDARVRGLPGEGSKPCGALVMRRIAGLVAIGEPGTLRAAAAVARGTGKALVESALYRRAAVNMPDERVITAWASVDGVRLLLTPLGGLLGTLGGLVDVPGLKGAAGGLVARDDGAQITIRRIAGRGARAPAFKPTLHSRAPSDTIAFVASGDIAGALQRLLLLAGPQAGTLVPQVLEEGGEALNQLGELGRESAVLVAPGPQGPAITLLARMRAPAQARRTLRRLEEALGRLFGAPAGPEFADADLGGPARQLSAGSVEVAYALDDDVLVLSANPASVTGVRALKTPLSRTAGFRAALPELPRRATSLVFLDPNQLLQLGASTGTGLENALQDVRDDLARVRAISVHTVGTGGSSTVELSLSIP